MGSFDPSAVPGCPAQLWEGSRTNLSWLVRRTFPLGWFWKEPGLPGLSEMCVRIEKSPFFLFSFFSYCCFWPDPSISLMQISISAHKE